MVKTFNDPADIIVEEGFLDWYHGNNSREAQEWKAWMDQHPSMGDMILEAIELMRSVRLEEKPVPDEQVRLAWTNLQNQLSDQHTPVIPIKGRLKQWVWAAAIIIIVAGAGAYSLFIKSDSIAFKAGYGQLVQQELPDGSLVTLNANSELQIGDGFSLKQEREVWLKGEAFFHVRKTTDHKRFVVHTDRFDVIVTGTQFNVINRGEKTSVLLTEGSVHLQMQDGNEIKMKPGEYVEFNGTDQFEKKNIQQEKVLAWKERKLMFDSTALPVAVAQIMDLFDVSIIIEDKAAADTATISGIVPNDNLDVLIAALEAATGLTATKDDAQHIKLRKLR